MRQEEIGDEKRREKKGESTVRTGLIVEQDVD